MKRTTAPQQYLFDWVNMATNNMAIPKRGQQNANLMCDSYPEENSDNKNCVIQTERQQKLTTKSVTVNSKTTTK